MITSQTTVDVFILLLLASFSALASNGHLSKNFNGFFCNFRGYLQFLGLPSQSSSMSMSTLHLLQKNNKKDLCCLFVLLRFTQTFAAYAVGLASLM